MENDYERSVEEYIALAPDDATWAREAVAPYADLTPAERLRELAVLNGMVDTLLAGRMPAIADGETPFWKLWKDPARGRPRG